MNKSGKKSLPISTLKMEVSRFAMKKIDMAIIGADAYCTTYK